MTSISIQLPEDLRAKAEQRAAEAGHASVSSYISALIEADASPDGPPHLRVHGDEALESALIAGLESPSFDVTERHWEQMRKRLQDRHAKKGSR